MDSSTPEVHAWDPATWVSTYKVTLLGDGYYDDDENYFPNVLGTRVHTGTAESVKRFARRTRVGATEARIERVGFTDGAGNPITFTIGIEGNAS